MLIAWILLVPQNQRMVENNYKDALEAMMISKPSATKAELARIANVSPQAVTKWFKGGSIEEWNVRAIADYFGADFAELRANKRFVPLTTSNVERGPVITREVPLISWVQAGTWNDVVDPYHLGEGESVVVATTKVSSSSYALRVRGDSMESPSGRSYPDGCIIIVDPRRTPENGDDVIVRLDDSSEVTFKQLVVDGGTSYLKPLNPRYPIIPIDKTATFCGVVVQMTFYTRR